MILAASYSHFSAPCSRFHARELSADDIYLSPDYSSMALYSPRACQLPGDKVSRLLGMPALARSRAWHIDGAADDAVGYRLSHSFGG